MHLFPAPKSEQTAGFQKTSAFLPAILLVRSAVLPKKEERQRARTGMRADGRPHMIDDEILNAQTGAHLVGYILCILHAVPMADENNIIFLYVFYL